MALSRINKTVPPNRTPRLQDIRTNFVTAAEDHDAHEATIQAQGLAIVALNNDVTALKTSTDKMSANTWEKFTPVTIEDYSQAGSIADWSVPTAGTISFDAVNKGLRLQGNGVSGTDVITTKTLANPIDSTKVNRISVKYKTNTPGIASSLYLLAGNAGNTFSAMIAGANSLDITSADEDDWFWTTFDTSEDITFASLGNITQLRLRTNNQAAPFFTDITIAKIVINDKNTATFSFTYNEGHNSISTIAAVQLAAANIKGSLFLPTTGLSSINSGDRLTVTQLNSLRTAGWGMSLDASSTGIGLTTKPSVESALQEYFKSQYEGSLLDFPIEHLKHVSYAEGYPWVIGNRVQIAAATSNGTNIVNLSEAVTISAGARYYGAGVQDGTIVVTGGTNVTSLTLNKTVPAQTKAAVAVDITSQFSFNTITDRLKSVGVKGGRIINGNGGNIIIEGFLRPLEVKAVSMVGLTLNQAIAILTRMMKIGSATPIHFNRIVPDPVGWTQDTPNNGSTIYASFHQGVVNLIKTWIEQNKATAVTFADLIDKYTPDVQGGVTQTVSQSSNNAAVPVVVEALNANKTLVTDDLNKRLDVKGAYSITVGPGLGSFNIDVIPPDTGVVTFIPIGGVKINGSTSNQTRSAANNIVSLFSRSGVDDYKLTGV